MNRSRVNLELLVQRPYEHLADQFRLAESDGLSGVSFERKHSRALSAVETRVASDFRPATTLMLASSRSTKPESAQASQSPASACSNAAAGYVLAIPITFIPPPAPPEFPRAHPRSPAFRRLTPASPLPSNTARDAASHGHIIRRNQNFRNRQSAEAQARAGQQPRPRRNHAPPSLRNRMSPEPPRPASHVTPSDHRLVGSRFPQLPPRHPDAAPRAGSLQSCARHAQWPSPHRHPRPSAAPTPATPGPRRASSPRELRPDQKEWLSRKR